MTVYKHDPRDRGSLPHDAVLSIDEDTEGNLWVATEGGGVAMLDRATDRFVRHRHDDGDPNSLASDYVRTLRVDSRGQVWVGFRSLVSTVWIRPRVGSRTSDIKPADPSSLSDRVYALFEDRDSALWAGTNGGLNRIDPATGECTRFVHDPTDPSSLSDDQVRAVLEDGAGVLWVGTLGGGLNRLDRATGTSPRVPARPERPHQPEPRSCPGAPRGRRAAVGRDHRRPQPLPSSGGTFARYLHDPADPASLSGDDMISSLRIAAESCGSGLRPRGSTAGTHNTWAFGLRTHEPGADDSLSDNNVTSFCEDGAGRVWVGTFGGWRQRGRPVQGRVRHLRAGRPGPTGLSDDRVMALLRARGTGSGSGPSDGGLGRYDPRPGERDVSATIPTTPAPRGQWGDGAARGQPRPSVDRHLRRGLNRFDPATGPSSASPTTRTTRAPVSGGRVTSWRRTSNGSAVGRNRGCGPQPVFDILDAAPSTASHHDPEDPIASAANTVFALHMEPRARCGWAPGAAAGPWSRRPAARRPRHSATTPTGNGLANDVI